MKLFNWILNIFREGKKSDQNIDWSKVMDNLIVGQAISTGSGLKMV